VSSAAHSPDSVYGTAASKLHSRPSPGEVIELNMDSCIYLYRGP